MLRRAGDAPLNLILSEEFVALPPPKSDVATVISRLLYRVSALTIKEGALTLHVLNSLSSPAPLLDSLTSVPIRTFSPGVTLLFPTLASALEATSAAFIDWAKSQKLHPIWLCVDGQMEHGVDSVVPLRTS
jgi:hypothetical protein